MKRLALLFLVAVLIPCGVLAWFAQRAMKDEQATYQRQHVLLAQEKSAALAARCRELLQEQLQAFEKATDDYLRAPVDATGEGVGEEAEESEVARWDAALKQRYPLAARGYLEPMTESKTMLALTDKAEKMDELKQQTFDAGPEKLVASDDGTEEFEASQRADRGGAIIGGRLMEGIEGRRAGGLGGAAVPEPAANRESLDPVETELSNLSANQPAPAAPGDSPMASPVASPPVAAKPASVILPPSAALKAKKSPAEPLAMGRSEVSADREPPLAKADAVGVRDADGPIDVATEDQRFAKQQQNRTLSEEEPQGEVKKKEDAFGVEESDKKLASGLEPEMLRRAKRSELMDESTDSSKLAADGREKVSLTVRTVAPQHLPAEAQVSLAKLSSQSENPPNLDERMRAESSGIAGRNTDDGGFQLVAWYRSPRQPEVVHAGEISVTKFLETLRALAPQAGASVENLCLAVLDQEGRPAFQTESGFTTDWSRPYVSVEIGPLLPRWEAAVYLLRPDALLIGARAAQWRLGLIVLAVLVAAIGGGALFWMETRRRWQEAQQKTDFVSQVSHELRTPLTAIQMFSDLLMKETSTSDPAKSQRYASVISQESQRLTRLINTVLDFSKLDRKGVVLDLRECDLRQIVEETLERYRPHLEGLGFTVTAVLPDGPVRLRADADRVAQILVNLLSNAEKYAASGRVIDVTLAQDSADRAAVVEVSDRGPGIPAGQEQRIFQKFYRADDRLHSGIQGTGLGLTLARALARAHGGDVTHARRAGGGSTFTLRLPTQARTI